jgi:tRNA dimethylallyltransferase
VLHPYKVILIAGPTASGKSGLALSLAAETGGRIINADSMQVYAGLPVITAQPEAEEQGIAKHCLYGHRDPAETYSVGTWMAEVQALLTGEALGESAAPSILVGGTGLYFKALTSGLAALPPVNDAIRAAVRAALQQNGAASLYAELQQEDPAMAARLNAADGQRIVRALEVMRSTGRSLVEWQNATAPGLIDLSKGDVLALLLEPEPARLAAQIAQRFRAMVEKGAIDEVRALLALRLDPAMPAMKAIGVSDIGRYLAGQCSLDDAMECAVIATRQYAKRQRTFFRGQFGPEWRRFADRDAAHRWLAEKLA